MRSVGQRHDIRLRRPIDVGTVAPVILQEGNKPEATLLVGDGEICGPGQVAKQMLGRSHVSFCGLGHDPRQLVDHIEDA